MPLPMFSLLYLKKYCIKYALKAIAPMYNKSALLKYATWLMINQANAHNIAGESKPIPNPIQTEFLIFAKLLFII